MSEKDNKLTLPTRWAEDPLSEFIQDSFKNTFAIFVNKKHEFNLLLKVDAIYRGISDNLDNSENPLVPTFLHRSHSAFLASCRLSLSGQAAETFPQLRSCLEYALYALHINENRSLSETWLKRHENKDSLNKSRQSFSHRNVMKTLLALDVKLHKSLTNLYQQTIDYGGHPNERAVSSSLQMRRDGDSTVIRNQFLHGDSGALNHALRTTAQIGLGSLIVFQLIYNERFNELGLSDTIELLKGML